MPTIRSPRKGSLQYWPRKRARRQYARVRNWTTTPDAKPLGFGGYKVGMTHLLINDNKEHSLTKGQNISCPITVIECPPIKVASLRFYKNTISGSQTVSDVFADNLDKEVERKILKRKKGRKLEDVKDYDDIMLLVYTQPRLTNIGKKKPEVFEIPIGGNLETKLEYAKNILGREIKINDVLIEGRQIDVHSISKGKGLQGPVRRFGIGLKSHKSEKKRRTPGNLGPWTGAKMWRVAQAGKTGYYQRTEHNKWLLKIGEEGKEITPKGGFPHYGIVKNQYILVKGSVSGTQKRLVIFSNAIRENKKIPKTTPEITYINID